ncbi:sedoheptulose 7-phosphate cyclase [Halomonas dongshanensis]|uniref:Sedoheptulose 7-phosphate cyclase n=1 Tax=Halomonas dongshanensis TaxID=2890835 RepID=A0ABT2EA89_9GAMM|nr:sedoheptulose 7-phosphate cyclase [Halomonas dongshanensis]MCS2608489.1 sedoheptulose 7-phosphate cyclase [Halomonas dongshanensis]
MLIKKESQSLSNYGSLICSDNCYTINSTLSISYSLTIEKEVFKPGNDKLANLCPSKRALIVIDKSVWDIYKDEILQYFASHDILIDFVIMECGEKNKSLDATLDILNRMESFGVLRRSEPVIAIGGGVLLDVVGFASSMYRRGIPYIRVPTTLMAMIDATLGIKTGINYLERRNRLGAYYAPHSAIIDTSFLKTVDKREISNGAGEIFKLAVVKDAELFDLLDKHGKKLLDNKFQKNEEIVSNVINLSIKGMLDELIYNMWELELQRLVDFGHSFSPLIEMKSLPIFLHGEAVALDVVLSCAISNVRGCLSDEDLLRVIKVASDLSLPWTHPLFRDEELIYEALSDTVLHRNGSQNLPLPVTIGNSKFVNNVDKKQIKKATQILEKLSSHHMEIY